MIVPEVCEPTITNLLSEYIKPPTNAEGSKKVAEDLYTMWDFPLCLGALGGRHIDFETLKSAGSFYYHYKRNSSIVLLGLTDPNHEILYVYVGMNGRISDGGVLRETNLK
nr:unnamed protein product [Callosobruchus analis]